MANLIAQLLPFHLDFRCVPIAHHLTAQPITFHFDFDLPFRLDFHCVPIAHHSTAQPIPFHFHFDPPSPLSHDNLLNADYNYKFWVFFIFEFLICSGERVEQKLPLTVPTTR